MPRLLNKASGKSAPPSLKHQLDFALGRPSGFDYMRIVLALSVVSLHSLVTCYGPSDSFVWTTPVVRPIARSILPMFFALSGFLVAGSLERSKTVINFAGLRMIRIYPALIVEIFLSALLIGPLVTTVSLHDYFTSPLFRSYLLNSIGYIHYQLPGVFENNPMAGIVNKQLWTVPYELIGYTIVSVIAGLGVVRRPILAPIAAASLAIAHLLYRLVKHHFQFPIVVGYLPGFLLLACFLCGVSFYLYRDKIPFTKLLFWSSLAATMCTLWFMPFGDYLGVVPVTYLTVYLGLCNPRRMAIIKGADLSYGVYLYGFVFQQLFALEFPTMRYVWLNILVCVPVSLVFAALSWNLVEKPAMKLKGPLKKLETAYLAFRQRRALASGPELTPTRG